MKKRIVSSGIVGFTFVFLLGVMAAAPVQARPNQGPVLSAGDTGPALPAGYALRSHAGEYIQRSAWTPGNWGRRGAVSPYSLMASSESTGSVAEGYGLKSSLVSYDRALKSNETLTQLPERGHALRSHGGHYIVPAKTEFKYMMQHRGQGSN